jgi:feruloyl esterase
MYHGFDDTRVAPADSINYYEHAVAAIENGKNAKSGARQDDGKRTQDLIRLFMVPGMAHCGGGPGPTTFDALSALEDWVERAVTPQRLIGSHLTDGAVTMTRPLCPYPEEAVYMGRGGTNDAASFACRVVR